MPGIQSPLGFPASRSLRLFEAPLDGSFLIVAVILGVSPFEPQPEFSPKPLASCSSKNMPRKQAEFLCESPGPAICCLEEPVCKLTDGPPGSKGPFYCELAALRSLH